MTKPPNFHSIYFKFVAGASILALILAYSSEYFLGLIPCKLCYYQRYAYFALVITCFIGLKVPGRLKQYISYLVATLLCVGISLAFTHVGVENGWFELDISCSSNLHGHVDSLEEFKAKIMAKDNVPCDVVTFRMLGVTMAGWNFVYSSLLFFLSLVMLFVLSKKYIRYED